MAACELEADRRIALTGTPVQNKIEDVWALFKFLRLSPIDDKDIFSKYILSKCKSGDRVGLARLQLVMKNCTLRRTKETTMENGEKLLSLPKRTEIIQWLALDERERGIYDKRVGESKEKVMELKRNGELSKNYGHVLQEILRLRQTCNHVDLVDSGVVEEDYDGTIMDWDSAVSNIDLYGFNRARAVSVMAYLKQGEENGTACMECAHDIGDWFPSVGLGGTEEDVKVEDDKAKTKKMPWKPILTKCHHVFCESNARDIVQLRRKTIRADDRRQVLQEGHISRLAYDEEKAGKGQRCSCMSLRQGPQVAARRLRGPPAAVRRGRRERRSAKEVQAAKVPAQGRRAPRTLDEDEISPYRAD